MQVPDQFIEGSKDDFHMKKQRRLSMNLNAVEHSSPKQALVLADVVQKKQRK